MKNITVSVDDETYRKARVWAAERETSVSALVREYLSRCADGVDDSAQEKGRRLMAEVYSRLGISGSGFSVRETLSREDIHDRKLARG